MSTMNMQDGTPLFFKDWGRGQPIVFSHGWPLDADAWDVQMLFLLQQGYRVIAHDRRGHGRSGQSSGGHDIDTYADDLATLIGTLELHEATLIGHSTGAAEITRYIGRHGTKRVSKAILIGALPPLMAGSAVNPQGVPAEVFGRIRRTTAANRSQFFRDLALRFYGYNRPGIAVDHSVVDTFWAIGMLGAINAQYASIEAFWEADFTNDLKKFNVPTMFIHGSDDQIMPFDSAVVASKLVKNCIFKVYPAAPHGLCTTLADQINADIVSFLAD